MTKFADIDELEEQKLRLEVSKLRNQIIIYEELLKANGLLESVPLTSEAEVVAVDQISRLKHISDSGLSFDMETTKIFETMVKTLMLAKGKAPVEEKKEKKAKVNTSDIGKLLKIAERKE